MRVATSESLPQAHAQALPVPDEVRGLQVCVLLCIAVRLAVLLEFVDCWGERDPGDLPQAWLRFQLAGGAALFATIGRAVRQVLYSAGKTVLTFVMDIVIDLWRTIMGGAALSSKAEPRLRCPVVIDEAQILTKTRYPHIWDPKVRNSCLGALRLGSSKLQVISGRHRDSETNLSPNLRSPSDSLLAAHLPLPYNSTSVLFLCTTTSLQPPYYVPT